MPVPRFESEFRTGSTRARQGKRVPGLRRHSGRRCAPENPQGAASLPVPAGGACSVFMASLDMLVAEQRSVLLIDTASTCVHVGLLPARSRPVWWQAAREAGVALFEGVAALLTAAGADLESVGAVVFCEGPGSILGVRTAAMAIRAWQAAGSRPLPAYSYFGLELMASDISAAGGSHPFGVIADARRGCWHLVEVETAGSGHGRCRRVPESAVAAYTGDLYLPDGFGARATPPRAVRSVAYLPPELWERCRAADLLQSAPQPEAFQYEDASYALWTPRIHRAPPAGAGLP